MGQHGNIGSTSDNSSESSFTLSDRLRLLHEIHFRLAQVDDEMEMCKLAVQAGRALLGFDRLSVWLLDPQDKDVFKGTYGIDEQGKLRDERGKHIQREWSIYDDEFESFKVPYKKWEGVTAYDDSHRPVGKADLIVSPLWNGQRTIGSLCGDSLLSGRSLSDEDCQVFGFLARVLGTMMTLKRTELALQESNGQLARLALEDSLTGLLNRHAGIRQLDFLIKQACRSQNSIAIVFLDADGLKEVNDQQGHQRGDEYLIALSSHLAASARTSDLVCRMGGDEFMLILPDSSYEDAQQLMVRVVENSEGQLQSFGSPPYFSYGISNFDPKSGCYDSDDSVALVNELIHVADTAMYQQKKEHHRESSR